MTIDEKNVSKLAAQEVRPLLTDRSRMTKKQWRALMTDYWLWKLVLHCCRLLINTVNKCRHLVTHNLLLWLCAIVRAITVTNNLHCKDTLISTENCKSFSVKYTPSFYASYHTFSFFYSLIVNAHDSSWISS